MRRLALLAVAVVAGCSWTDEKRLRETSVTYRIAYTQHLPNGDVEVWVARLDGSGKRRLAAGATPALSPDGRWIAYQGNCRAGISGDCPDLMLVSASGGRPRLLVRGASRAAWSPTSDRVAASQTLTLLRSALLSIEVPSGTPTTIARGGLHGWSFSPEGDELAYGLARQDDIDLHVAPAGGGPSRRLTDDGESAYPVWGAGGIAFARLVPYRGWGAHEIWVVRADGTRRRLLAKPPRRLLVQGVVGLLPIEWSGDGRRLLTALWNEFGGVPYVVDARAGRVRAIGDYGYRSWPHGISRDGRRALVAQSDVNITERATVEVVPLERGRPHVIARRATDTSWNG